MMRIYNREKSSSKKLDTQKRYVEKLERGYAKSKEESLLLISSRSGTIKFLKIWVVCMSPVAPGYSIYSSMSLATYDLSDMMLRCL